jgi:hypothetical protein
VRNIAFNLVSGFQSGAKGNFVTVENNGAFPNCPDTIRIKVNNISDIEYVNGDAVSKENTVAFVAPQTETETEEQIMTRIRERFDILNEMTKACVNGDIRAMIVSVLLELARALELSKRSKKPHCLTNWQASAFVPKL